MEQSRLDHVSLIRTLSTEQRSVLTKTSDVRGLRNLALHWGAIAVTGWLIAERVPFWQAVMVIHGALLMFLFTLLHETSHSTAFKSAWLNKAVAGICGFVIVLPPVWFRYFHFAHHRHTHVPERDPELAAPKPETLGQYAAHLSGIPIWWSHIKTLLVNALGWCDDAFVPRSKRAAVCREARIMIGLYGIVAGACVWLGTSELMYLWVLPALFGQPFLRLYLMAEHGRCPHVANLFENTRTTFTNRIVRTFAWNMPFHAEHHAYPTVPFHRLADLHELTRAHLLETERGYVRFHGKYLAGMSEPVESRD